MRKLLWVVIAARIFYPRQAVLKVPILSWSPTIRFGPSFANTVSLVTTKTCARGDLNLSSIEGIKAGSSSGVSVVPHKPDESLVYLLPAHLEDPKMPPNSSKFRSVSFDLIRRWIEGGLIERSTTAKPPSTSSAPSCHRGGHGSECDRSNEQ